ncbi:MAG TPA: hypothetical protein VD866_08605, partial [Urbifossiella sp.]|nr:hypothetical protein [Urbifossiella sp.]
LRELGLNGNAIGADGAAALATAAWVAGLDRLEIADNGLTADDVGRLLDAALQVTAVDVSRNEADVPPLLKYRDVTAVSVGARSVSDGLTWPVAHAPGSIRSLDLRHTRFPLREHGPFPALAHLNLGFTDCGDAFDTAAFPALRSLNLRACRLARPALRSDTLETLDLSVNPLADPEAAVAGCPNLTHLNIANTGLTDAGLVRLLAARPRLRSLNLAWNPLKAAAVAAIVAQLGFTGRLSVDLTGVIPGRSPLPP